MSERRLMMHSVAMNLEAPRLGLVDDGCANEVCAGERANELDRTGEACSVAGYELGFGERCGVEMVEMPSRPERAKRVASAWRSS